MTALVTSQVGGSVEARNRLRFTNSVQRTRDTIESRLNTLEGLLQGGAALFVAAGSINREGFRTYVARLELATRYPGIQGIGASVRIAPGEEDRIAARLRADGFPEFRYWPEGLPGGERHAIVYLEPLHRRHRGAIGFNMHSEPIRRAAMNRARDTGRAAASGKVSLIDEGHHPGFLIYVPMYDDGVVPKTLVERRRALRGFVYSPFRADELFGGISGSESDPQLHFEVYDGTRIAAEHLLHSSSGDAGPAAAHPSEHQVIEQMEIDGRPWTVRYTVRPGFEAAGLASPLLLAGVSGLLISGLLLLVTWSLMREREIAEDSADVLRAANRQKDEFLAMLAHELRNPLSPVVTAARILKRTAAENPAVQRQQEVIERQVRTMGRLLDDLLEVSRITRGRVGLRKECVDLRAVVSQSVEVCRGATDEHGHEVVVELPDRPVMVEADPVRLEQVFSNLIHNAAKYTEPGGRIRVRVEAERDEAEISIRDDGMGIMPELLPRIFDLFTQGERTMERSQGGLGIGLTMVRTLIEMHGGCVEARSEGPGRGSEFLVRLPIAAGRPEPRAAARESG